MIQPKPYGDWPSRGPSCGRPVACKLACIEIGGQVGPSMLSRTPSPTQEGSTLQCMPIPGNYWTEGTHPNGANAHVFDDAMLVQVPLDCNDRGHGSLQSAATDPMCWASSASLRACNQTGFCRRAMCIPTGLSRWHRGACLEPGKAHIHLASSYFPHILGQVALAEETQSQWTRTSKRSPPCCWL